MTKNKNELHWNHHDLNKYKDCSYHIKDHFEY